MGSGGESDPGASDAPSFLGIPAVALERLSVRDIAPADFERAHVDRAVPAVLTDVAASWPCASKWTLAWFAETHGDVRVAADDGTKEKMKCTLREFAEMAETASASRDDVAIPTHVPYLRTWNFLDDLPELKSDFEADGGGYFRDGFDFLKPAWRPPFTWAFLGGAGARTKLHVDVWHTDAWLTVTQGRKRFVLFHPGQMRYVYNEKTQTFADLDAFGGLETIQSSDHPDFAKATPVVAVVAAGETIYIPRGWPHYAVALEAGVSLTVNFLARANRRRVLEKAVAFANRRDACEAVLGRAPRASDNLLKFCVHGGSIGTGDAAKIMGVDAETLREKMSEARRERLRAEAEAAEEEEEEEEEKA